MRNVLAHDETVFTVTSISGKTYVSRDNYDRLPMRPYDLCDSVALRFTSLRLYVLRLTTF